MYPWKVFFLKKMAYFHACVGIRMNFFLYIPTRLVWAGLVLLLQVGGDLRGVRGI